MKINNNINVLVTGGLGFVGSNLVDALVGSGYTVTVLDNLSSESSSIKYVNSEVRYIIDDIRNINELSVPECDVVFHLAGLARIQPSFSSPIEYMDVNIMGTVKICEFVKDKGCKLIYSSSSSINNGEYKTPYTFSKWGGEEVLRTWSECYEIDSSVCRFYNVYGPREPSVGEYSTVVSKFVSQYNSGTPLTIIGDGEQRRDFTHISDIVCGLIRVYECGSSGEVYHLGCGVNYSINELVEMFDNPSVETLPLRLGEGRVTLADYDTTFKKLNWKPKYSLPEYIKNVQCY